MKFLKRNLAILSVVVPFLCLVAWSTVLIAADGFKTGSTVGTEVYTQGFGLNVAAPTGTSYTALTSDDIIRAVATAATTIALPSVAAVPAGKVYIIGVGTRAGTNAVTIDPAGSELIDAGSTYTGIDASGDSVLIFSTGTEWVIGAKNIH